MLEVRFWGVRGSIPCPGPETVIYGGNTTCLEIRADERLIIVDLGTGVRPLGDFLIKNDLKQHGKIEADVFLTHTHWDHIMGFPSFSPIFIPSTVLRIFYPVSIEKNSFKFAVKKQFSYPFWPVRHDELAAHIEYTELKETTVDIGNGLTVTSKFVNHPVFCLSYRFSYKGRSITALFDHEPYYNLFSKDNSNEGSAAKEGEIAANEENEKIYNFIKGTDILIHDAQYSQEDYQSRIGWGHSSFEHAVNSFVRSNAEKLVFFHHEPAYTDSRLEQLEKKYADNGKIFMAKEGMTLYAD